MSMWSAIVAIVFIVAFANIRIAKYRALGRSGEARRELPAPREAELEREVIELKKRLAVLERIATDDRHSKAIAQEIEALRDA